MVSSGRTSRRWPPDSASGGRSRPRTIPLSTSVPVTAAEQRLSPSLTFDRSQIKHRRSSSTLRPRASRERAELPGDEMISCRCYPGRKGLPQLPPNGYRTGSCCSAGLQSTYAIGQRFAAIVPANVSERHSREKSHK
ncbi:hypothetical protein SKAU_G00391300 [Synaphobranchus kaupii]|uniref:Uncharacterized protein n=1 Tax=Synaphobranchus kaupii TaxID=118154 RepID=A0A9Q1IBM0_SYNKA|nr:hypothetical protein SKAU_G00391300 [Synaphobranchus kaupii]